MPKLLDVLFWVSWGALLISIILLIVAIFVMDKEGENAMIKWRIIFPTLPILLPVIGFGTYFGVQRLRGQI